MKQLLAGIMGLILLTGCNPAPVTPDPAPTASAPAPGRGMEVRTDWSRLEPRREVEGEPLYTRRYEGWTDTLIPASDYGNLLPYVGAWLERREDTGWGMEGQPLFGLANGRGELITDPVFQSVQWASWRDRVGEDWESLPLLILGKPGEHGGERVLRYALAAGDGSWVTPFQYLDQAVAGPQGVVLLEEGGDCVLLNTDGQEVWRTPGRESWFWDTSWRGGVALLWDGERRLLMDTATGEATPLSAEMGSPQGFNDGLAAVWGDGERWGYIDASGRWVIPPTYDRAGDFKEGRAIVEQGDNSLLIDRAGKVLLTTPNRLFCCQSRTGRWFLEAELDGHAYLVKQAYDRDGRPMAGPAAGTVLRWGAGGWMYQLGEGRTILWDGPAQVTLPEGGEVSDVTEGNVILYDLNLESSALVTLDGEVLLPYGRAKSLYASADSVTGALYYSTGEEKEPLLIQNEEGRVLVSSNSLCDGLLTVGEYGDRVSGYTRPDGAWVFRYVMPDHRDIWG